MQHDVIPQLWGGPLRSNYRMRSHLLATRGASLIDGLAINQILADRITYFEN